MFLSRNNAFTFNQRRFIASALKRRASEIDNSKEPLSQQLLDYANVLFASNKYGNCLTCQEPLDLKLLLNKPEVMYCSKCYSHLEELIAKENLKDFLYLGNIPTLRGKLVAIKRLMLNSLLANRSTLSGFVTKKSYKLLSLESNQDIKNKVIDVLESNFTTEEFVGYILNDFYEVELELDFKLLLRLIPYLDENKRRWLEIEYEFIVEESERKEDIDYMRLLNSLNLKTSGFRFISNDEFTIIKATGVIGLELDQISDNSLELLLFTLRYQNTLLKTTLDILSGESQRNLPELNGIFRSKGWSMMEINHAFNRYLPTLSDELVPLVYYFSDSSEFRLIFPLFNDNNTSKGELAFSFDKNEILEDGIRGFVELPLELKNEAALKLVNTLNMRKANPSNIAPWITGNWIVVEQEGRSIILYSTFIPNRFKKYSAFEEHIGNIISEVVKSWEYYKVEQEFLRATEGEVIGGE